MVRRKQLGKPATLLLPHMPAPSIPALRVVAIDLHMLFVALALAAGAYGFWLVRDVVVPLLLVGVVTFVGAPVVAWLEAHRWPRGLGAAAFVVGAVLFVAALLSMVVPALVSDLSSLFEQLPEALQRAAAWAHRHLGVALPTRLSDLSSEASRELLGQLRGGVGSTTAGVLRGAASAAAVLTEAVLVPVLGYFALTELPRIQVVVKNLVPKRTRPVLGYYVPLIEVTLSKLVRGQLVVAAIDAVLYVVGLTISGVPLALAIGVIAGAAYFIPFASGFVSVILAVAFSIVELGSASLWPIVGAVITMAVVQSLEAYILTPRIVGEKAGLSPFAAILAVVLGGAAAGLVGALFALPVGAVVALIVREEARRRAPAGSEPTL